MSFWKCLNPGSSTIVFDQIALFEYVVFAYNNLQFMLLKKHSVVIMLLSIITDARNFCSIYKLTQCSALAFNNQMRLVPAATYCRK